MKRVLFLVNAASGMKNAVSNLFNMVSILTKNDCLVTVYPIVPSDGLVSENVPEILKKRDFDVITCCGGDGTLNHVVNMMMKNDIHLPVGYIPTGSTNDFSKSMNQGRSLSLEEQCLAIAVGKSFAYDIGRLNDMYFNYVAAFGAFTKVSYDTPQKWKNALGYGAYVLNMISNIPGGLTYRKHVRYEYDNGIGEGEFIFGAVSNTLSVAGIQSPLVRNSVLNDGKFEVILITAPKNINDMNQIVQKMLSGNTDDMHVIKFETSHIKFHFDEDMNWTLDGEEYCGGKDAEIDNCNEAIRLYVAES